MRLLVDTNVLIDGCLRRRPFYEDWKDIILFQTLGDIELWASAKSFTDVHYISRRALGTYDAQDQIIACLEFLHVCSIDGKDIKRAAEAHWKDFEDCVIYQAARKTKADAILTRNQQDFEEHDIPTIPPKQLLERLYEKFEIIDDSPGES